MTLAALHARFLQHCAMEKRLRPMTIKSYRSDFGLFLKFLRREHRSHTLSEEAGCSVRRPADLFWSFALRASSGGAHLLVPTGEPSPLPGSSGVSSPRCPPT